ncbi:MAG: hypothetical protein E6I45_03510, partial [Chloroflexi bacterium]
MPAKAADPDALRRESAGRYVSGDGRFTVEAEGSTAWYVADTEQTDQLGQPVLRGPFSTLAGARAAVAEARGQPVAAGGREAGGAREGTKAGAKAHTGRGRPGRRATESARRGAKQPPDWLSAIDSHKRPQAQQLVSELAGLGIEDPERIVAADLGSDEPLIAEAILERRLRDVLGSATDVKAVLEGLRAEGFRAGAGRPA